MENSCVWAERFRKKYKPLLGEKYNDFEYALSSPKGCYIRISKTRNINYINEVNNIASLKPASGFENMYEVTKGKENITSAISFQTGGFYIMNPSSAVPAMALASVMPEYPVICDISAAPGGKTCALSDYIDRRGLIIANELSSSRLKSLHFNLEKYGCYNVKTTSMDGRLLSEIFPSFFDGILLDAPCSNENKIFRNKRVQSEWSDELVNRMSLLQRQLIKSAFSCLAPGGFLVYSTCTMSPEENELTIKYLLDEEGDAELLKMPFFAGGGISGYSEIDEKTSRIMPSPSGADGFYAALIRKKGELAEKKPLYIKRTEKQENFFREYFINMPENTYITEKNGAGYWESLCEHLPKAGYKRYGLNIYKNAGKKIEPSSSLIWELGKSVKKDVITEISRENALNYLKGFDLPLTEDYKGNVLFCEGIPLGYAKPAGNTLKNKLNRYFLYGKNIEW